MLKMMKPSVFLLVDAKKHPAHITSHQNIQLGKLLGPPANPCLPGKMELKQRVCKHACMYMCVSRSVIKVKMQVHYGFIHVNVQNC